MKNFKLTILGVVTLLFALTLNFRHALDDYGISKNKLHVEVLAQSNGTGGGGTTGGGGSTSPNDPTGEVVNSGECSTGSTIKRTFTSQEVLSAKLELGSQATTSQLVNWLLKLDVNGSFQGSYSQTSSNGLEVSWVTSEKYAYKWVQCLNNDEVPCVPVPRINCN